jgi:hypothetical protein
MANAGIVSKIGYDLSITDLSNTNKKETPWQILLVVTEILIVT